MNVLWLTPNKPENISVGRQRITSHLEADGFNLDLRPGGFQVIVECLRGARSFDVVVGTTRAGAVAGMVVATALDQPLVVDHVDPIRQFEENNSRLVSMAVRYLECLAFCRSSHTLYVYPEEKKRVLRFAPEVSKTDLGVDYELFADPDEGVLEAARAELSDRRLRENVAIYVGGLEPIYHIRELVDSVSYLDEWSLLVLGSGSQSQYVTDNADGRAVTYLGTVSHDEVPGYLHAADVGVSLVDDPNTLKVLEYGAARLPTVQLAGKAEQRFKQMVEFCDPDPASIAAGIERANAADMEMLDDLQSLAADHSWRRIADDYANVLHSVVSQKV